VALARTLKTPAKPSKETCNREGAKHMKKFLIALFALAMVVGTSTGCRTAEGAGEDIESVGEGVQDVVRDLD
jgi:predicted small secreted protein